MSDIDGGLRAEFRERLPHFDWQSIETGGTGKGVADSNFCYNGAEGWIEYKQTALNEVRLKPEQVGWLDRRARHGGYVFVGVRQWYDPRWSKFAPDKDALWLLSGGAATLIKKVGLVRDARFVLGIWEGGPSQWDWITIGKILTRRYSSGTQDAGG